MGTQPPEKFDYVVRDGKVYEPTRAAHTDRTYLVYRGEFTQEGAL